MKKLYVLLLFFSPFILLSQITLMADDLPQAGDVFTSINCEIPIGFNIGSPGANQIYDFSSLIPIDTFANSFISPSGTPGQLEFPNATLTGEFEGDYVYYQQTSSAFYLLGLYTDTSSNGSGQYAATHFNPTSKVFEIPTTYNTNYSDLSTITITNVDNSGSWDSIRSIISTIDDVLFDGYGTVVTPNGSFDGLRERRISTLNSSFETYSMGVWTLLFSTTSTDTSYNWYGNNNINLASVDIFEGEIINISYSTAETQLSAPVANFSNDNLGGGMISFNDNSSNVPSSWLWDFGDGNTSTQQNPTHTYASPNTYNVCLTVTNSAGSDMICMDVIVTIVASPISSFTYIVQTGGIVNFTDASINNPTSWSWDFGDGNTSTEQNPQHTYAASSVYDVCLTVTNSAGSNLACEMVEVIITATDDIENLVNVEIFPNPISDIFNIKLENPNQESLHFQLINTQGKRVIFRDVESNGSYQINVKKLATGMYYYNLLDSKGMIRNSGKVVKK